ncbi:MAG: T9SS type A sorting domain-containing protein, partial [Bacteroidales bacterium]
ENAGVIRQIEVYDLFGHKIFMSAQRISDTSYRLDLTALPAGIYHLVISRQSQKEAQKLIVLPQ